MQSFDMQRLRTKVVFRFLISKMTTRLGATPKGAADKANFPLAPILGPQFILCLVSQPPSGTLVWAVRLPYRPLATPCLAPRGEWRSHLDLSLFVFCLTADNGDGDYKGEHGIHDLERAESV